VKRLRRILMLLALAMLVALAVLCVVGAFLGADRAGAMFTSGPLVVFWCVLSGLLLCSLLAWPGMLRRPGVLAAHLGALLVLGGGMWGSERAHALRQRFFDDSSVRRGQILLAPAHPEHLVVVIDPTGQVTPVGSLGFFLQVNRAWTEYYPPADPHWSLLAVAHDDSGEVADTAALRRRPGEWQFVPFTDLAARIDTWQPRPTDPQNGRIPPPELVLDLRRDGEVATVGLEPPESSAEPASQALSLEFAFDSPEAWQAAGRPELRLVPPDQPVRDYKIHLRAVHRGGRELAGQVVEFNHPMRVAGYDVYLRGFPAGNLVLLEIVRDPGLPAVWIGFALLGVGLIVSLWGRPVWRWFQQRRRTTS
jgi:hypothetical protein